MVGAAQPLPPSAASSSRAQVAQTVRAKNAAGRLAPDVHRCAAVGGDAGVDPFEHERQPHAARRQHHRSAPGVSPDIDPSLTLKHCEPVPQRSGVKGLVLLHDEVEVGAVPVVPVHGQNRAAAQNQR